jgi:hypothetical protein
MHSNNGAAVMTPSVNRPAVEGGRSNPPFPKSLVGRACENPCRRSNDVALLAVHVRFAVPAGG